MTNSRTLTHVHTPIRLGQVEVGNRIVRPAHQTQLPYLGNVTEELVAYHEARAAGGVGLTILETMGIHPTSPGTLWGFHPDLQNRYPRMMERLRGHGMDQPHVISSNGLFEGERRDLGNCAVVLDDLGHYEAVAAADHLISRGLTVSFVTRPNAFAPRAEPFLVNEAALQRLNRGDFRFLSRTRAVAVEPDGVVVCSIYGSAESNVTEKLPADTVVVVSNNRPNRALFEDLKQGGIEAHVVGDANSPRFLSYATLEGHRAGAAV